MTLNASTWIGRTGDSPRKQRAAIALNYRHGYSVDECAVFMGCRAGTVRTHLERGLAKLRKELKDD